MDVFRPLSAAAVSLRKQAMNLLKQIPGRGVINRVFEIFIIRAERSDSGGVATVIEVPAYLVGGYGGQDGSRDFYTPFVIADVGPVLSAITSRKIRRDEIGEALPNIPTDKYKGRLFTGSGRVVIGDVPAWGGYRQALNDTTGVYTACRSAITIAVCPALAEETSDSRPWARSLTICRVNGSSGTGEVSNNDDGNSTGQYPVDVLPGHVAMTSTPPTGLPERISGFEISADELGIAGAYELQFAGAVIEWGALRGLAAVQYRTLSPSNDVTGNGLKFVAYEAVGTEADGSISYTGSVVALGTVSSATIPSGDGPTGLPGVAAADASFTYPPWATNTTVYGRDAGDGRLLMRDPNLYARLFSSSMGYAVDSGQPAMTLVEIQCEVEAADVTVRGYKGSYPVTFNTVEVPAIRALRWQTYVASISPSGSVSLTKLADFLDSRYEPDGPLLRKQIQSFGGCATTPTEVQPYGEPRLFCSEWGIRYEVRAAEADGPAPILVQGEPERRVRQVGSEYVRLSDLDFYLLAPGGDKTPLALGAYFPALFGINTSPAGTTPETTGGRFAFGNSALHVDSKRVGNDFPLVHCQFAPGIIAMIVAPVSGYTSGTQILRVALFSVATGAMLVLSPALLGVQLPARMSISCFEQGTVDEAGNLLTYGRLVIGVSTTSILPTRNDGWFVLTGLRDISWLAREPSNTSPHYVGNPMVPAEIGVTTKLTFTKPTLD